MRANAMCYPFDPTSPDQWKMLTPAEFGALLETVSNDSLASIRIQDTSGDLSLVVISLIQALVMTKNHKIVIDLDQLPGFSEVVMRHFNDSLHDFQKEAS